ncbi:MAG: hypothetical protein O7I93_14810 [Gemmatimonadetes bacterium]|nr:hypothetical protein [Gemmatimonadota bacterium]
MFERLRDAIESMLDAATPPTDARGAVGRMQEAVVEAKTALVEMREQLADIQRKLERERQRLEDAERRGKMAENIDDEETARIAEEFASKHREKAAVFARKLEAQRAELDLAERELAVMREQFKKVRIQAAGGGISDRIESAWRDIESAGGVRPGLDLQGELLRTQLDAAAKEAAADEQLRKLKKKMGR